MSVAALYVRKDSPYKALPDVDAWDADRDARLWPGGTPVVAHPPCAQWGRLRKFAREDLDTKLLGPLAVEQVRTWGGVLEHPVASTLWQWCGLPHPRYGVLDQFGGWTLQVDQFLFGHPARKATWLYIVGCLPGKLPRVPHRWGYPSHCIECNSNSGRRLPAVSKAQRELTPVPFAQWLVEVARRCATRSVFDLAVAQ